MSFPSRPRSFGSDPFGSDPFGSDPFGSDPFGSDPFGSDPFGSDPFGSGPDDPPFGPFPGRPALRRRWLRRVLWFGVVPLLVLAGAGGAIAAHHRHPAQHTASAAQLDNTGPKRLVTVPALAAIGVKPAQVAVAYAGSAADPALYTDIVGVAPARHWQASIYEFGTATGEATVDVYQLAPGTPPATALAKVGAWFHTTDTAMNMTPVTSAKNPAGWSVALEGSQPVRYLDFAAVQGDYLLWGSISLDLNSPDPQLLTAGRPLMKALSRTGIGRFASLTAP